MIMYDLEFYTSKELIEELLKRKTFQGIIINNPESVKSEKWNRAQFTLNINSNLSNQEAISIMKKIIEAMENQK